MNKNTTINKVEFIKIMSSISEQITNKQYSKSELIKISNLFLETIVTAIKKKYNINMIGYFSLSIQHRISREGRNPKTGEKMFINAYNQPTFKTGKKIKDACN